MQHFNGIDIKERSSWILKKERKKKKKQIEVWSKDSSIETETSRILKHQSLVINLTSRISLTTREEGRQTENWIALTVSNNRRIKFQYCFLFNIRFFTQKEAVTEQIFKEKKSVCKWKNEDCPPVCFCKSLLIISANWIWYLGFEYRFLWVPWFHHCSQSWKPFLLNFSAETGGFLFLLLCFKRYLNG